MTKTADMKFSIVLISILGFVANVFSQNQSYTGSKMVCYYDSTAFIREGLGKLVIKDLELALGLCNYLVYGYAGIDPKNFKLKSIHENLDLDQGKGQFRKITELKRKFPHLKILLGVGGDVDRIPDEEGNKYLELLESNTGRIAFINSAHTLIKSYGFDGLDLAWQFPKNKAVKVHNALGKFWKSIKKIVTGDFIVDTKADEHKEEFSALVRELKLAFRPEGFILGMTVLPNVNSTYFYDVPFLNNYIDFVNLFAFDFQTSARNNEVADYPAPIYALSGRNPEANIDAQVQFWLNRKTPPHKIIVGAPAYGQAWIVSRDSGLSGVPPISYTKGVAPAGPISLTPGILTWPEVCAKINSANAHLKGDETPLRRVGDPQKKFGPYAYRIADDNDKHGLWVAYEDPESIANKAAYVRAKGLGGLAFYELSMDDFRGSCSGDIYPLLRAAKFRL